MEHDDLYDINRQFKYMFWGTAIISILNFMIVYALKLPYLPWFYLFLVGLFFILGYFSSLRLFIPLYVISFLATICQALLTVYVLGDDCGIQLYLLTMLIIVHYIRLTNYSETFQKTFIVMACFVCIAAYMFIDELADYFLDPIEYVDEVSEIYFTLINAVGSISLMTYVGNSFAAGYQKEFVTMEDRNRKFEKAASQDELTGLKNRRGAEMILNKRFYEWRYFRVPFTVAIGDIDYFKNINDQYGHEAGDMVLSCLSKLMEEKLPGNVLICRWGGEEFLYAFPGKLEFACTYLEEIRKEIESRDFAYQENILHVTITIGAAEAQQSDSLQELIRIADQKLYEGKENGRNRLVFYS